MEISTNFLKVTQNNVALGLGMTQHLSRSFQTYYNIIPELGGIPLHWSPFMSQVHKPAPTNVIMLF